MSNTSVKPATDRMGKTALTWAFGWRVCSGRVDAGAVPAGMGANVGGVAGGGGVVGFMVALGRAGGGTVGRSRVGGTVTRGWLVGTVDGAVVGMAPTGAAPAVPRATARATSDSRTMFFAG